MALILASGSPRRRELMSLITPDYTVITSDVDETKIAADSPAHLAKALATAKARAVAEENPDDVVCGFDTVVECEGEVFGKPKDEADAVRMLRALSGREHRVHTGVIQPFQMRRQADDLNPPGHGVDGAVDPYIVRMGIGYRRLQLIRVKVSGEGPHTEVRTCQIYSVRAVEHGHFQPLHIPCRSQQLRQLSLFIHFSKTLSEHNA